MFLLWLNIVGHSSVDCSGAEYIVIYWFWRSNMNSKLFQGGIMKGIRRVVAITVLVSAVLSFVASGTASAEIKFGILPRLSAVELTTMYTPLAEYLSNEIGEKVTLVIPKDFDAYKTLVEKGQVDMGFSNSIVYIQLKKIVPIDALAVSAEKKAGTRFRGIMIARKDSSIEKAQDLKGKKLIFVDKDSAAGYIFQMLR